MLWINFSNFVNMLKYKCGKIEINFTKLYMNVLDDVIKFVWFFFFSYVQTNLFHALDKFWLLCKHVQVQMCKS